MWGIYTTVYIIVIITLALLCHYKPQSELGMMSQLWSCTSDSIPHPRGKRVLNPQLAITFHHGWSSFNCISTWATCLFVRTAVKWDDALVLVIQAFCLTRLVTISTESSLGQEDPRELLDPSTYPKDKDPQNEILQDGEIRITNSNTLKKKRIRIMDPNPLDEKRILLTKQNLASIERKLENLR